MSKYQYTTKGFTKYLTGITTEQLTQAAKVRHLKLKKQQAKRFARQQAQFFDPAFKAAPTA